MDLSNINTATYFRIATQTTSNTPNFKKLRQSGKSNAKPVRLPFRNYEHYILEVKSPQAATYSGLRSERDARGIETGNNAFGNGFFSTQTGGTKAYLPVLEATYLNNISNRLIGKVRDSPLNLGTSLGEFRETAEFIAGAMKTSANVVRHVKRGNFAAALRNITNSDARSSMRDVFRQTANANLACMYGLKPLVSDVYESTNRLSNYVEQPTLVRVYARGVPVKTRLIAKDGTRYYNECDISIVGRGCLEVEVENSFLFTLDKLGVLDPVSIGWELLPLSFVLDWFIPVGKYLQGFSPPKGIKSTQGYLTYTLNARGRQMTNISIPPPGWKTEATFIERRKKRTVITSFPQFWFTVPDVSLSQSQVSAGLSLLTQAFL